MEPTGQSLWTPDNTVGNNSRIETGPEMPDFLVAEKYSTEAFLDGWYAVVHSGQQPVAALKRLVKRYPQFDPSLQLVSRNGTGASLALGELILEAVVDPNIIDQIEAELQALPDGQRERGLHSKEYRLYYGVEEGRKWVEEIQQPPRVVIRRRDHENVLRAVEAFAKRQLPRLASQLAAAYRSLSQVAIEESIRLGQALPMPDQEIYVFEIDIEISKFEVQAKTSVYGGADWVGTGKTAQAAIQMLSQRLQQALDEGHDKVGTFKGGVVSRLSLAFSPQLQSLEQLEEIED